MAGIVCQHNRELQWHKVDIKRGGHVFDDVYLHRRMEGTTANKIITAL